MVLQRKSSVKWRDLQERYGHLFMASPATQSIGRLEEFIELQHVYSAAMHQICTKLEILDDEFQIRHEHNPIHHLECRIKSPQSIADKLERKGLRPNVLTVRNEIMDIAGVRVVCNYIDDVYAVEELLTRQTDIALIRRKDYIARPKANGYRSLHLIMSVPVFLSERREVVPVEVQLRTVAMDLWASLEHELTYKNDVKDEQEILRRLVDCSEQLTAVEEAMQKIHKAVKGE